MRPFANLICWMLAILLCSTPMAWSKGPAPGTQKEISELARAIMALGAGVDPEEARRAARVSYEYTYQLAQEYQITDGPLTHNSKVNMGTRPRGLCWHWAQDIEERLKKEHFKTLELHRAVANSFNIRLEHSTAIISRKGDDFRDGIVLDPWRKGGELFWSPLLDDKRYNWLSRDYVNRKKREIRQRKGANVSNARVGRAQDGYK